MRAAPQPNNTLILPFASSGFASRLAHVWRNAFAARARRKPGKVWLVGAGPGDPDLLTLRALKLLRQADVIAYDHLVSREILNLASPRARMICVGKRAGRHSMAQGEINAVLVREAVRHKVIVRLKGGDPGLFGRSEEEISALTRAGIDYGIVPGITAALGCAAAAGIPLTQRGIAQSVHFVAGQLCADNAGDLDWARLADPRETLVLYMAKTSLSRHAAKLMAAGMPADMPVLIVHDGTLKTQRVHSLRLADCIAAPLPGAQSAQPALIIIGQVAHASNLERAQAARSRHAGGVY